jgi:hypothetical protein
MGWLRSSGWILSCAASVLAIAGCSSNEPSNGRSGGGTGGQLVGTGGAHAPMGTGGAKAFGNGPGTNGGPTMVPTAPPPPTIDPSAAAFARDDTAMSGLDPGALDALKKGSGPCGVKVTFPYEGTVFPGGLAAPIIMYDGAADAVYVHFAYDQSDKVDYQFAAKGANPGELQIPRDAWNEITRRTNGVNLNVTLNTSSGGAVGSCAMHWKIAAGNMIGAIYYNTYQAPAPGVMGQGAVMQLSLGATAVIYKQFTGAINAIPATGPCYSCHSVSFNGTTLVASFHDYNLKQFHVEKYDVNMTTQPMATGMVNNANFGALTPKGDRILAMGNPQCTAGSDSFPRHPNNFPLVEGPAIARVLDTASGTDTMAKGLNPDNYMWMPQFAPNGDKVVFNHAKPDGHGGTDRRELAIMDYDAAGNAFSNLRVIISAMSLPGIVAPSQDYMPVPAFAGQVPCGVDMCGPDPMSMNKCDPNAAPIPGIPGDVGAIPGGSCTGPCYPAWPFFTPDGKAVIFSMISEPDFAVAFPGRDKASVSELWYVDLETLEAVRLDKANAGLKDIDKLNDYYPTVMPVAVGGYFWIFWTAVRDYGHRVAGRDPNAVSNAALEAIQKRIWVAAIRPKVPPVKMGEVQTTPQTGPLTDPSYPGFYLDGQSESGNVRAFAALNPCLANGSSCTSGLDCCCGYCLMADNQTTGACSCEVPKCAKINEKCMTTDDCCPPARPTDPKPMCIGGFCAFLGVQ